MGGRGDGVLPERCLVCRTHDGVDQIVAAHNRNGGGGGTTAQRYEEGFRYVRHDRTILCMIGLIALTTIFIFPFLSVMLPLYVRNILHLGPDRMGVLMAVSGSGSLAGSLGLLSIAHRHRFRFMTAAAVVVSCALFCMSRLADFTLTAVSMCILAIALSLNFGLAGTIVQERAPSHLRGRISAIFGLSFFGLMPIAGLLTTGLSDLIGMRTALMLSSIAFGAGALFVDAHIAGRKIDAPVAPLTPAEPESRRTHPKRLRG